MVMVEMVVMVVKIIPSHSFDLAHRYFDPSFVQFSSVY